MAKEGGKPRLDRKTWFTLWKAAEFVKTPKNLSFLRHSPIDRRREIW